MPILSEIFARAQEFNDARRPLAAIALLESVADRIPQPETRGFTCYNIGCLYRSAVGEDGRARTYLEKACESLAAATPSKTVSTIWPNAVENRMLLSRSYDEYFRLADELRRLNPNADILRGQVPPVRSAHERGVPWYQALDDIAHGYYDRADPQRDAGLYGDAASIFHLLLTHRKQLRMGREGWRRAIIEYGNLRLRLGADTSLAAEKKNPRIDPLEFVPLVKDAMPFMDEFMAAHPDDSDVEFIRTSMRRWIDGMSTAAPRTLILGSPAGSTDENAYEDFPGAPAMRCPDCGRTLSVPAARCPECGRTLVRMGIVIGQSLVAGIAAFLAMGWVFESAPVWVAALAGFLVANVGGAIAFGAEWARLVASTRPARRPGTLRRSPIDAMLDIRRPGGIRCPNGHEMESIEEDGIPLAACPVCGIVKPIPGAIYESSALMHVASKFENFEM